MELPVRVPGASLPPPSVLAPAVRPFVDWKTQARDERKTLNRLAKLTRKHGPWRAADHLFNQPKETTVNSATWERSSFCNGAAACVEVAFLPDGNVAMRDGKNPGGVTLTFTPEEWRAFTAGVRNHEFDVEALEGAESDATVVLASGHQDDATSPPETTTGPRAGIQIGEVGAQ